jgi:hypothetical protein
VPSLASTSGPPTSPAWMKYRDRANGPHHARPDYKRTACAGRLLSWLQPRPWIIALAGCVGPAVASPGWRLPQKRQVDWLSNEFSNPPTTLPLRLKQHRSALGKLCPSRAPIGLPKDRGAEAHRPILTNCKAGRLSGAGGWWKKFEVVGAATAAASSFCYIFE